MADALRPAYDCRTCGACCTSPWEGEGYVRLYDIDLERLRGSRLSILRQQEPNSDTPEEIVKLGTTFDAGRRHACVALSGRAGEMCACSVYERRPEACRKFEIGGALCRAARQRVGLPL